MEISANERLMRGFAYAQQATSATDEETLLDAFRKAAEMLQPISAMEHGIPKASFGLGLLFHEMGARVVRNESMGEDERKAASDPLFAKAAGFFRIAAAMANDGDFTPARAKDTLALMHELGYLGPIDLSKAFALRHEAAEAGFAEAQVNIAIMYYRAEGIEPSVEKAYEWMKSAWDRRGQLSPSMQSEVSGMLQTLEVECEVLRDPSKAFPSSKSPKNLTFP